MTAEEEESIPVTTGRKEGYTSHRSPVCRRANTENQTTVIWQNGPMDRPEELLHQLYEHWAQSFIFITDTVLPNQTS